MILLTNNNSEKLMQTFYKHYVNSPIYLHSPIFTTHYKTLNRGNDTSIF